MRDGISGEREVGFLNLVGTESCASAGIFAWLSTGASAGESLWVLWWALGSTSFRRTR